MRHISEQHEHADECGLMSCDWMGAWARGRGQANGLALLALFNRADQRYPRKPCVADDSGMFQLDHRGSTNQSLFLVIAGTVWCSFWFDASNPNKTASCASPLAARSQTPVLQRPRRREAPPNNTKSHRKIFVERSVVFLWQLI